MTTDVIADMLTRIRNANQRYLKEVKNIPSSKLKVQIAKILKDEGFIADYKVDGDVKKTINITLKYQGKKRSITGLERVSKPGLRKYFEANKIPSVINGLGISIVSTSKGIMTGKQALQANIGGEVLASIW